MKKYTEEDVKGLTKAQVIEKLTAEGVEFDANVKKDDLVTKLLEVETDQESPENQEGTQNPSAETTASESQEGVETQSPEAPSEEKKESSENIEAPEVGPSDSVLEAEKKLATMQNGKTADSAAFAAALSARQGGIPTKGSFEEELAKRRGGKLKKLSFGQALAARLRNVKKNL